MADDASTLQLRKAKYKWKVGKNFSGNVLWDAVFLSGTTAKHDIQSWTPSGKTESEDFTIDPITLNSGSNGFYDICLLPVWADSTAATISPKYRGATARPFRCTNAKHVGAGEKIINALTIYYKAVCDEDGKPGDFDVTLTADGADPSIGIAWSQVSGPDSGNLVDADSATATFQNPKKGGLYEFELDLAGSQSTNVQVWLPVAGPDISAYWESEITYFHSTWGPKYRAKLDQLTHNWPEPVRSIRKKLPNAI